MPESGGKSMRLDVRAFALTCGLLWGVAIFGSTWWIIAFDGPSLEPTLLGRLYRGFSVTPRGSLVGLLWAVPDGALGGAVFAWLYNRFATARGR